MRHEIRLAGPWEQHVADEWIRFQLPLTVAEGVASSVRRKFHRPSGVDGDSRLWLIIDASAAMTFVALNAEQVVIGSVMSFIDGEIEANVVQTEVEVTSALKEFNTVEMAVGGNAPSTLHRVKLRIVDGQD